MATLISYNAKNGTEIISAPFFHPIGVQIESMIQRYMEIQLAPWGHYDNFEHEKRVKDGYTLYGCFRNNECIGGIVLWTSKRAHAMRIRGDRSTIESNIPVVMWIVVDKDHRRKGVASSMLEAICIGENVSPGKIGVFKPREFPRKEESPVCVLFSKFCAREDTEYGFLYIP